MRSAFEYIRPRTLTEALEFLKDRGNETSVVAGGTDLMIDIRKGALTSRYVLDVSRLDELRNVEFVAGKLQIGAAVTFTELIGSPAVAESAGVLAHGCRRIGSTQIRNVATLGGNVANASPAADGVTPLVVLGASAVVRSDGAERIVPVEDLISGPYRTTLKHDELIIGFRLDPLEEGTTFIFQRIARRQALAVARINVAVTARRDSDGTVKEMRMSVGSVLPSPGCMTAAEQTLIGNKPTSELIREAAQKVSHEMIRQSGDRPSMAYKKPAVEGLVIKALSELFDRGSL
jgi:CO/xanthine dehydrogenase FAD-binding subunit